MTEDRPLRIGVIGSGESRPEITELARQVGEGIAREGAVLVCGGLGGVMEAAAEGARAAGGITVGILPGAEPASANRAILIPIPSGLGEARNALVVRASEAVIGVAGGWGTLAEAAFCLKLGVPLILLASELPELPVPRAQSADQAVGWAIEQAGARRG
ncbi:MAG: TIGR00725 family protein [Gemmatimonadota bacterium]|nr:MAG: TIGR00725 family protein [Gemmatimonadota bacterium]